MFLVNSSREGIAELQKALPNWKINKPHRPSCHRCGSGCRPYAVCASLYTVGV